MSKPLSQEELNEDMATIGIGRYRNKVEAARKRKTESETKAGQRLMRGGLPTYTKAIDDMVKGWSNYNRARWQVDLRTVNPAVVGFITIRAILDCITRKEKMTSVSHHVGARIEDQVRCDFLIANNEEKGEGIILGAKRKRGGPKDVKAHIRRSMQHEADKGLMPPWNGWTRRDRISCGLTLIELLRHTTGIIEYIYILDNGRKRPTRYVTATKETLKWIEEFNTERELLEPFFLPTAQLPKDWINVWEGGYEIAGTSLPRLPFIKTSNMDFLRTVEGSIDVPMEACNLIQQTPWRVNNKVLEVMQWAWQNNTEVGGLPNREDEQIPDIPTDFHQNEESNKRWRKIAAGIYSRNASTRSRRLLIAKVLYLADKMRATRFFYPSHCDFRGRIYNIPAFLGVQGPDMCRGLLHFSRPETIKNDKDAYWLAVHGANTWGYDKVSLGERVRWADDFAEDAQRIVANPTKETLWMEADKPWQFLAWVFEWAEYTTNGKIKSHLPVNIDATNNGLQILSLLTRDEYGMAATNVLPTETPADIYRVVSEYVERKLREDNTNPFARAWLEFGITRSTTKRSVMCYSYGLSSYSNRMYINEWYDDEVHGKKRKAPFDLDDRYIATNYLSTLVWQGIETVLHKPKQCMQWFQDCARLVADKNRPLKWVTPTGFPVHQEYHNIHHQQVNTWISGKATCVKFNVEDDRISKMRQKNGVSPNFVHSLDGSCLAQTVVKANQEAGIYDFSMIHDSYGTHANKIPQLNQILRNVFFETFSVDLLRDWKLQLEEQNPDIEFPEPPEYGNADVSLVKESAYFFN